MSGEELATHHEIAITKVSCNSAFTAESKNKGWLLCERLKSLLMKKGALPHRFYVVLTTRLVLVMFVTNCIAKVGCTRKSGQHCYCHRSVTNRKEMMWTKCRIRVGNQLVKKVQMNFAVFSII